MCVLMRDWVVTAHSMTKWDTGDPGAEEKVGQLLTLFRLEFI